MNTESLILACPDHQLNVLVFSAGLAREQSGAVGNSTLLSGYAHARRQGTDAVLLVLPKRASIRLSKSDTAVIAV
jgi:hypothetical protein